MSGLPVTLDATLLIVAGIVAITVAYWLGVVTCWYASTRALQDDAPEVEEGRVVHRRCNSRKGNRT